MGGPLLTLSKAVEINSRQGEGVFFGLGLDLDLCCCFGFRNEDEGMNDLGCCYFPA
jgi:hypothetical protein